MKTFFRHTITAILIQLAKVKLAKSGAKIIGITGSVGKTSSKDAIAMVLAAKNKVHFDKGGYNTDIGLPLGILGLTSPMSMSILAWLGILWKGFISSFKKEGYDFLVAEMGVDTPGDMDKLLILLQPHIAVLTCIAPVHLGPGQFSSVEDILHEKKKIFSKQHAKDIAIINMDDPLVATIAKELPSTVLTYGSKNCSLILSDASTSLQGTSFTVEYKGEKEHFFIPVLGTYHAHLMAPSILIGLHYGYSLQEIRDILATYTAPKGRMRLIEGKNGSTIIDGSYNASVTAVKAGVDMLASLDVPRKIICLGNMNELGGQSVPLHKEVGEYVVGKADVLIAVAKDAVYLADAAKEKGFSSKHVHFFEDSVTAGKFLASILQPGDGVFVKGSQNGVRLERLVKEVMKYPEKAKDLLVRQTKHWTK